MKNKFIREFRDRYKTLEEERELIMSYIENTQEVMDSYYTKYFEIDNIKQRLHFYISGDKIDAINVEDIFYFSADGNKIYPLNSRNRTKENLNKILKEIANQLKYYKDMTIKYCEIIQLHINKLELLEDAFYKVLYTIDYLELGSNSIEVNNKMGYGYYLKSYYNSFSGYESSRFKLKKVEFKESDILKFMKEIEEEII